MKKKIIAISLILIMIQTLFISTKAKESSPKQETSGEITTVREIEKLRTKTSETYLLSDGTCDCVVYSENKYFDDGTGKLISIDNTLIQSSYLYDGKEYCYKNAANETIFRFAEQEPAVLISYGEKCLAYSLIAEEKTQAIVGGSEKTRQVGGYSLAGENYIAYPNIADNTELVYAVYNGSVKEYIILENADAPTEFIFRFENEGYHIEKTEYDRLAFFDENGEQIFDLGSLYAVDAAGKYTDQLHYEIKEADEKTTLIAVHLSEEYANDPERVFPILIDPSIMITNYDVTYDTFVSSKFPTTNYCEDNHLRTGYDDDLYIRRTYIRFIIPSYLYDGANYITEVRLRVKQYIGTTPEVKAYRVTGSWTSGNLTWNNKPSYTTTGCSGYAIQESNNWYSFYITNIIKNQLKGTYGDYGVMLKDDTESGTTHWTTFYSSEASSPNKPELHITYNEKKFLDYGFWSSSVDIRLNTYADVWASAINNAIASWNNSGAPVYFYSIYNTTYGNDINVVNNANPWYGRLVTTGGEGNELISFYVELNSGPITTDASNLSNFIQSVLVQYLGTAIWLDEDPVTPYDSIMKNNRNRNTLIAPTQYDVQNVSSKYTN